MSTTTDLHSSIPRSNLVALMETRLYDAIAAGELKPGYRIVEAELARRLDISRAPIREAARRLESRGLLIWKPRRGFFVRQLTSKEVHDIYGMRIALESHAIEVATKTATPRQLSALSSLLEAARTIEVARNVHRLVEVDVEFHRMICEIVGNKRLLQSFDELASELRLAFSIINRLYESGARLSDRHAILVEAMRRRDSQSAVTELVQHLEHSRDVLMKAIGSEMESASGQRPAA